MRCWRHEPMPTSRRASESRRKQTSENCDRGRRSTDFRSFMAPAPTEPAEKRPVLLPGERSTGLRQALAELARSLDHAQGPNLNEFPPAHPPNVKRRNREKRRSWSGTPSPSPTDSVNSRIALRRERDELGRRRRQRRRHHPGKEDTRVRQLARSKPGALGMSMMAQMIRQTGETAGSWALKNWMQLCTPEGWSRATSRESCCRTAGSPSSANSKRWANWWLGSRRAACQRRSTWSRNAFAQLKPHTEESWAWARRHEVSQAAGGTGPRGKEGPTRSMGQSSKKSRRHVQRPGVPRSRKQRQRRRRQRRPLQRDHERGGEWQRQRKGKRIREERENRDVKSK